MTLALDTNVLVELIRGRRPEVRERYFSARSDGETLMTSLIAFHELCYGAAVSADPARQHAKVAHLLRDLPVEPLTEADMLQAATVRAGLKRLGTGIGPYDSLIAGQALARDWTLVTANTNEFNRIPGLLLQDWTKPE